MIEIASLVPTVSAQALGAPEPAVRAALYSAARTFFRDTLSWTADPFPQGIKDGQNEYFIITPQEAKVERIYHVWINGRELVLAPIGDYPHGSNKEGSPVYAYITGTDRLKLFPTPNADQDNALTVVAVFNLKPGATKLPDYIADHERCLTSRAVYLLKSQAGTAWYDPTGAAHSQSVYLEERTHAIADRLDGRTMGGQTMHKRRFM